MDEYKMLKNSKKLVIAGIAVAMLTGVASMASAQQIGSSSGGLGLIWGVGDHYQRAALSYETPSFWTYDFSGDRGRLDAVGELSVAHWWANGSRHPKHVWQFGATPFLRWWANDRFFVELGIGVNGFSRTRFANKTISTAFQFGDHIGVAYQITPNSRIGLRYSHFSNASIKKPNPGLDILQLNYLHQF